MSAFANANSTISRSRKRSSDRRPSVRRSAATRPASPARLMLRAATEKKNGASLGTPRAAPALRALREDPLDHLGRVLHAVDRVLEQPVQVAQLDDLERVEPVAEQARDGGARQAV